jgi:RHH-type rel operon transcriptional repressor/antitoxin RelB
MYGTEMNPMLALRLPPEIDKRLSALAKRTGRSRSFHAREAILAHIGELEDGYLALEALEEGGEPIPLEELEKEFGLE